MRIGSKISKNRAGGPDLLILAHFPLCQPPWLKMRLFLSLVLGAKFGASSVPFSKFHYKMPIGGAPCDANQLGTNPMGWLYDPPKKESRDVTWCTITIT